MNLKMHNSTQVMSTQVSYKNRPISEKPQTKGNNNYCQYMQSIFSLEAHAFRTPGYKNYVRGINNSRSSVNFRANSLFARPFSYLLGHSVLACKD